MLAGPSRLAICRGSRGFYPSGDFVIIYKPRGDNGSNRGIPDPFLDTHTHAHTCMHTKTHSEYTLLKLTLKSFEHHHLQQNVTLKSAPEISAVDDLYTLVMLAPLVVYGVNRGGKKTFY